MVKVAYRHKGVFWASLAQAEAVRTAIRVRAREAGVDLAYFDRYVDKPPAEVQFGRPQPVVEGIEPLPCSSDRARVSCGRPFRLRLSDGTTRRFYQTWDNPCPSKGVLPE